LVARKWFVFYGKNKQGPFEIVGKPFVTQANNTLTFKTREEGKLFVYFGSERKGPFGEITENDFRLNHYMQPINISPDEKTIAFLAILDNDTYLFIGNEKLGPFENASWFTFAPDGEGYAFAVSEEGKWHLVAGKKEENSFDWVGQVDYSPDGTIVSYWCEQNEISLHMLRIEGDSLPGSFIYNNGAVKGYIVARESKIEIFTR
jgi:hypothetical protein